MKNSSQRNQYFDIYIYIYQSEMSLSELAKRGLRYAIKG